MCVGVCGLESSRENWLPVSQLLQIPALSIDFTDHFPQLIYRDALCLNEIRASIHPREANGGGGLWSIFFNIGRLVMIRNRCNYALYSCIGLEAVDQAFFRELTSKWTTIKHYHTGNGRPSERLSSSPSWSVGWSIQAGQFHRSVLWIKKAYGTPR